MSQPSLQITGLSWVLGGNIGYAQSLPEELLDFSPDLETALADFSCKPYLQASKGFLDTSAHYVLAACSLLRSGGEKEGRLLPAGARTGLACLTYYGAPRSGFTFFQQMTAKGPRFASPLIFPQSYNNTAANLAAIEFSWSGPHSIFAGPQDCRLPWRFASDRMADGSADCLIVVVYEATTSELLPAGYHVRNGAIAVRLEKPEVAFGRQIAGERLCGPPPTAVETPHGSVQAQLNFLRQQFTEFV